MSSFAFTFKSRPGDSALLTGTAQMVENGVRLAWKRETQFFPRHVDVKEIVLSFDDLQTAEYHQGWFRAGVVLMVRALRLIGDVPGYHPSGGLALMVARDQREEAQTFTSIVAMKISEATLARVRDPLDS